jgi:hypothetical protein
MNYWWVVVVLAIVLSEDLRYFLSNFLYGLDNYLLFGLFLLALVWWSKTK